MSIVLELMNRNPITAMRNVPVKDAAKMMADENVGAIAIVDDGKLAGITTERDFLTKIATPGNYDLNVTVSEIMKKNPVTVTPETSVEDCLELFLEKGFRHLPVVDSSGKLVGMLSSRDFLPIIKNKIGKIMDDESYKLFLQELDSM